MSIFQANGGSAGGGGGGSITVGTFGSTPNSAGASVSGSVLTLQPADATHPGGVSTTTQTIAGAKTFSSAISSSVASGSNFINALDGAHLNLSTADTSSYLYRSAADTISSPATLRSGIKALGFQTAALATPVNAAFATATTGGSLAAGTYYYRVAALAQGFLQIASPNLLLGGTLPSTETSQVVPAGTATNTVTVNWGAVEGAVGYNIYGRTTGAEQLIGTVTGTATTFVDTGSVSPSGALPVVNTTQEVVIGGDLLFNNTSSSGDDLNASGNAIIWGPPSSGNRWMIKAINNTSFSINNSNSVYMSLRLADGAGVFQVGGVDAVAYRVGSSGTGTRIGYAGAPTATLGGVAATVGGTANSFAFKLTVGNSPTTTDGVITLAAAPTGYVVSCSNVTSPDTYAIDMVSTTTTLVTIRQYNRTTGVAANFVAGEVINVMCMGY